MHLRGEEHEATTTGLLRFVKSDVSVAQEVLGAVTQAKGNADADADVDAGLLAGVKLKRLGEDVADAVGDHLGSGIERVALDEDHELVAAEPPNGVAIAQQPSQPGTDDAQQLVARGVTEGVVDHLEAVEVQEHHRELAMVASSTCDRVIDAIEDQSAVGQIGERVMQREVAQLGRLASNHAQRLHPAARQHPHEPEQQPADPQPGKQNGPELHVGRQARARRATGDPHAPGAVGVDRDGHGRRITLGRTGGGDDDGRLADIAVTDLHQQAVLDPAGGDQDRLAANGADHPAQRRGTAAGHC